MNKEDIIKMVCEETKFTKKEATLIIDSFLSNIVNALDTGEVVRIANFGKFGVREKKARIGVNPITKAPLPISEIKSISFHANENVKKQLNKDRK